MVRLNFDKNFIWLCVFFSCGFLFFFCSSFGGGGLGGGAVSVHDILISRNNQG